MQSDGNLVLTDYDPSRGGNVAYWASNTTSAEITLQWGTAADTVGSWAILQNDGNFVVYSPDGGAALWQSHTAGADVLMLIVQDDGNVVLYDSGGNPLWNVFQDNDDRAAARGLEGFLNSIGEDFSDVVSVVSDIGTFIEHNAILAGIVDAALAATGVGAALVAVSVAADVVSAAEAGAAVVQQVTELVNEAQAVGQTVGDTISAVSSAAQSVPDASANGFNVGVALAVGSNVSSAQILATYDSLSPADQAGFNIAFQAAGLTLPVTSVVPAGIGHHIFPTFPNPNAGAPTPKAAPPPPPSPVPTLAAQAAKGDALAIAKLRALGITPPPVKSASKSSAAPLALGGLALAGAGAFAWWKGWRPW